MHFVGPLASLLMTRYGGHWVCMSGAAMAALGLLAASYVNNIPLLILFYSVLTGLGFGLMYIPSIVSCVPYFSKNRLTPIILWEQHTLHCNAGLLPLESVCAGLDVEHLPLPPSRT